MRQKSLIITLLLTFAFSVQNVNAALIYDEAVSGDLNVGPTTYFNLAVGTNTIMGIANMQDTDDFGINAVAPGFKITGGVFTALFAGTGSGFYNSSGVPVVGGGTFQGLIDGDESVLIDTFINGIFRTQNTTDASGEIVWRYDFMVSAIPEPASLLLICFGLSALRWTRRKV